MSGLNIPGSDATAATQDLIKDQTDKIPRMLSGVISTLGDTETTLPASLDRIQSGAIEILEDTAAMSSLITDLRKTVYDSEVVASGIQLTGSAWLDVLDVDPVLYPTKLAAITLSTSGDLIGTAKYRIADDGGVKMFPHVDENVLNSGSEDVFTHTVDISNADGYKVQVRTTSVDDTSGKTVSLTQLNKIELV